MTRRFTFTLAYLIALALLLSGCVADSQNYKALVAETFPLISDRMGRYDLSPAETADVQRLRDVSADRNRVSYPESRAAWQAVAPSYRQHVGDDGTLSDFVRGEWLSTADRVDEAQEAEAEYRRTVFGGG